MILEVILIGKSINRLNVILFDGVSCRDINTLKTTKIVGEYKLVVLCKRK